MKTSSAPDLPKPIDPAKARNCLILNQLACPGLGTVLARRPVGYVQILFALAGFSLICGWFVRFIATMLLTLDYPESGHWHWNVLAWGAVLFAGAWVWSLFSSLAILKAANSR